jgi:hypothetical protein
VLRWCQNTKGGDVYTLKHSIQHTATGEREEREEEKKKERKERERRLHERTTSASDASRTTAVDCVINPAPCPPVFQATPGVAGCETPIIAVQACPQLVPSSMSVFSPINHRHPVGGSVRFPYQEHISSHSSWEYTGRPLISSTVRTNVPLTLCK